MLGGVLLLFMVALAALASADTAPRAQVAVTKDGFSATAPIFQSRHLTSVEDQVRRDAAARCAGQQVDWGRFTWVEELGKNPGQDIPTIKEYRRDFRCVEARTVSEARAPEDWQATAADEADARRFFNRFVTARDAGSPEVALAMFEPGTVEDAKAWMEGTAVFNATVGPGNRRITGVTWYVNPQQATRPGVFVAIDFVGDHAKLHFYCGYVGLLRKGPGDYRIVREEQNIFERGDGTADPAQIAASRAALCRGG